MGWKKIKGHYRIVHNVLNDERGMCIGTGYISDLIVIGPDGAIKKRCDRSSVEDLDRYQKEMDADPATLKDLFFSQDDFEKSIPVWTYDGDFKIVQQFCEAPFYPNVTHCGTMMYNSTHSTDKSQVIAWAKNSANIAITQTGRAIERMESDLNMARLDLQKYSEGLADLNSEYPDGCK